MTFDSFGLHGLSVRRLGSAVAASVAVHLLIFWPAGLRVLSRDAPSLLHARLLAPVPVSGDPEPVKPKPPAAPDRGTDYSRQPPSTPLRAKTGNELLLEPAPPASVPRTMAASGESVESAAKQAAGLTPDAAVDSALKARGLGAGAATAVAPSDPRGGGEAADGLRGYRIALAAQARRFKRYPAQALASAWEGSVEVRLDVGADGVPWPATVVRSSGHSVLDQSALAMIDAGARRARLPESLRGTAFAVVLPVHFSLDEE